MLSDANHAGNPSGDSWRRTTLSRFTSDGQPTNSDQSSGWKRPSGMVQCTRGLSHAETARQPDAECSFSGPYPTPTVDIHSCSERMPRRPKTPYRRSKPSSDSCPSMPTTSPRSSTLLRDWEGLPTARKVKSAVELQLKSSGVKTESSCQPCRRLQTGLRDGRSDPMAWCHHLV